MLPPRKIADAEGVQMNIAMVIQQVKNLGQSRELSLAITKLEEADLWLGKAIAESE